MAKNLAVYIDESGNFDFTKQGSKFYVLSFVFAESSVDYTSIFKSVKYPKFHAVPIIKGLGDFESLNTIERRKIFSLRIIFPIKKIGKTIEKFLESNILFNYQRWKLSGRPRRILRKLGGKVIQLAIPGSSPDW